METGFTAACPEQQQLLPDVAMQNNSMVKKKSPIAFETTGLKYHFLHKTWLLCDRSGDSAKKKLVAGVE